jgi:glycosyltransferase involved in cell wall biosynthesis
VRILTISAQKPDSTGSGVYLTRTVEAQLADGHEACVVCGVNRGDATDDLPAEADVRPVVFDTEELPFFVFGMSDVMPYPATKYRDMTPAMEARFEAAFSATIEHAIRDFRPDAIVVHHLYLVMAIAVEAAEKLCPAVPVVAISHATDLRQYRKHPLERERIRAAAQKLQCVGVLHEALGREVKELLGIEEGRIRIVGTGYDRRVFKRDGGKRRVRGSLLFVGKVCRAKGADALVESLGLLPCYSPMTRLDLAGGWGTSVEERAAVQDAIDACRYPVHVLGRIPENELALYYRTADVFVLPSLYEGLPLVIVEALASGCKVVATDLPGVRPWIESSVPDAPVWWVEPPAMHDVDVPDPEAMPAFTRRIATAVEAALEHPSTSCDTSGVSWEAVAQRIVDMVVEG